MAPLQPLSGTESLADLKCTVYWKTVGETHSSVEFRVEFPLIRDVVFSIYPDGRLQFNQEPLKGFTSAPNLRKAVALLTWCYRTAYREVFHIQDADQLLFM